MQTRTIIHIFGSALSFRGEQMERVTGIEPVTEAWEAFVIPFHHTRITLSWDMLYPEDRQEGK